jgi:hypothetical protein
MPGRLPADHGRVSAERPTVAESGYTAFRWGVPDLVFAPQSGRNRPRKGGLLRSGGELGSGYRLSGGRIVSTIRRISVVDRFWQSILDRSFGDVPRPTDAPFSHASGRDPFRVLLFGSGAAVGWGLRSHQLALPGQLARELGERASRGVDVDLIADKCMTALSAASALAGRLIAPYDAVVVSLGMTDSLRLLPARTFRARMRALLHDLSARTSPQTRLVLLGMQPVQTIPFLEGRSRILDGHAARFDRVLREVSGEDPKASYVGMSPVTDPVAGPTASVFHYRAWAEETARHLAPTLLESRTAEPSPLALDEAARLETVRELGTVPAAGDGRFDRIIELARSAFSADIAAITLMDGDHQWMLAASGIERIAMPRSNSIGVFTLGARAGFVVGDLSADRRFDDMYAAGIGMRFYAGLPLHAPNGQPVGTLCVLAAEPRTADTVDLELLRDIAMLVQREMWVPQAVAA